MKWKIPLVQRQVGGIGCPRPEVMIRVVSRYGLSSIRFAFDSGADLTTIPIPLARDKGIEYPDADSARGTARGLVGSSPRFRGVIRVLIGGEGFELPCDFLVPPPSAPQGTGAYHYGVLGRAGFLKAFAACVDDEYLILRRRFLERPAWYRLFKRLWPLFPKPWASETPL